MPLALGKESENLRISFEDMQGNALLISDAVAASGGLGRYLCPTDLLGAALGGCVMMTLSIAAKGHSIDVSGMSMEIEKDMSDDVPRRVSRLGVRIFFTKVLSSKEQDILRRAAATCPVKNSLHPDMEKQVELIFM